MHRIILALGLFFLVAPAMADEGDFNFKNPEAIRALEDYRKKLSEEQQIQRRAIEILKNEAEQKIQRGAIEILKNETKAFEAQWRKELIAKLEAIRTKLRKDGDSSEANKINDAIKALKKASPAGGSAAHTKGKKNKARIPSDAVKWNGHYYKVFESPSTHPLARKQCEKVGGHLAQIESDAEQQFLWGIIKNGRSNDYHIDGSDQEREGKWIFGNGKPMVYFAWLVGEPNNERKAEHFICMVRQTHAGHHIRTPMGRWYDIDGGERTSFICEWDGPVVQNRTPQSSRLTDTETTPPLHRTRLTISDLNGVWKCWNGGTNTIKDGKSYYPSSGQPHGTIQILDSRQRKVVFFGPPRKETWRDIMVVSQNGEMMTGKNTSNMTVWWKKEEAPQPAIAATDAKSNQPAQSPAVQSQAKPERKSGLLFQGNGFVQTNLHYRGVTPITIEATVRPGLNNADPNGNTIVANCESSGVNLVKLPNGNWGFWVHDGKKYQKAESRNPIQPGKWVALAGVFDGNTVKLFVDGVLQSSVPIAAHKASKYPFMVGANPHHKSMRGVAHFSGLIEEVKISAEALYDESYHPADGFKTGEKTMLWLKLDKGKGNIARDASKNKHHCRIHNAEWTVVDQPAVDKSVKEDTDALRAEVKQAVDSQLKKNQ